MTNEGIYDSSIDASTDIEIGTNRALVKEYRDPRVGFTPFVFYRVVETKSAFRFSGAEHSNIEVGTHRVYTATKECHDAQVHFRNGSSHGLKCCGLVPS